ncbi:hypothetical protein JL722_442 [Aureococcus anophagefferens]|nr:hypothetical protein JL722_442 [Aureococcus anophagefferens]
MDSNYEILESLIAWIAGDESGGGDVERYLASPRVAALARVLDLRLDEEACLELFAKVTDRARRRELAERLGLARGGALDDDVAGAARRLWYCEARCGLRALGELVKGALDGRLPRAKKRILGDAAVACLRADVPATLLAGVKALSGSAWAQPAERAAVAGALAASVAETCFFAFYEVQILDTEAARLFEAARDLSAALDDAGRKAGTPSLHPHAAKLRRCRDVLLLAAVQALDGSARFRDRGAAAPSSSTALFLYGDAADGEEPTEPNALREDAGAAQRFVDAWPAPEGLEGRGARGVAALAVALLKRPRSWDAADPASEQELRRRLGDALDAGVCRFLVRTHGLLRGALRDGGGGREPVVYLVALGELANAFVEALLDVDALPGPRGDVEGVPDGLEDVLALVVGVGERLPAFTEKFFGSPENEFAAVAPSGVFDGSAPPPGYSLKNFLALVDRYGEMLRANELERSGATPPPPGAMQNLYRRGRRGAAAPAPCRARRSQPGAVNPLVQQLDECCGEGEGVADRDLRGAETRLRTYGATGAVLALLAAVEPHLDGARVAAVKFAARDVLRCARRARPLRAGSADWADDFDGASRSPSPSGGFAVLYDALGPACGLLRAVAGLAARAREAGGADDGLAADFGGDDDDLCRDDAVPPPLGAVQPGGRRADAAPRELPKAFEAMQTSPGPDGLPHPSFALATAGEKPGGLRGFRDDDLASVRYFGCEPQGLLSELAARVAPRGARHAEATSCRAVFLLSHVAATSTDGAEIDRWSTDGARFLAALAASERGRELRDAFAARVAAPLEGDGDDDDAWGATTPDADGLADPKAPEGASWADARFGALELLAAPETRDLAGWLLNGGALSAVVDLALACTAPLDKGPRLAARACETGERALGLLFVLAKRRASRSAVVDAVAAGDDGRALTTLVARAAAAVAGDAVPAASARLARALLTSSRCARASKLPEGVAERSRGRCRGAVDAYFGAAPSILGAPFRVAAPEPARLDDALPADVADRLGAWAARERRAASAALDLADAAQRLGVVAAGFAYEAAVVETTRDADLGPVPYLTAGGDPSATRRRRPGRAARARRARRGGGGLGEVADLDASKHVSEFAALVAAVGASLERRRDATTEVFRGHCYVALAHGLAALRRGGAAGAVSHGTWSRVCVDAAASSTPWARLAASAALAEGAPQFARGAAERSDGPPALSADAVASAFVAGGRRRDAALDASTLETAAAALLRLGAARQDVALRLARAVATFDAASTASLAARYLSAAPPDALGSLRARSALVAILAALARPTVDEDYVSGKRRTDDDDYCAGLCWHLVAAAAAGAAAWARRRARARAGPERAVLARAGAGPGGPGLDALAAPGAKAAEAAGPRSARSSRGRASPSRLLTARLKRHVADAVRDD